jgi:adenine deaminase
MVLRRGRPVTEQTFDDRVLPTPPVGNSVRLGAVTARTFAVPAPGPSTPVIGIIPGKILTERLQADLPFRGGERHADPTRDLSKVCVLERTGAMAALPKALVWSEAPWLRPSGTIVTISASSAQTTRTWRLRSTV